MTRQIRGIISSDFRNHERWERHARFPLSELLGTFLIIPLSLFRGQVQGDSRIGGLRGAAALGLSAVWALVA